MEGVQVKAARNRRKQEEKAGGGRTRPGSMLKAARDGEKRQAARVGQTG